MNKLVFWKYALSGTAVLAALVIALVFALPDDAEAKRMGGGRSFGGSPSMSSPAPKAPTMSQPGTATNRQSVAPGAAAGAAGAATAARPGLFGGMGGMFGGLLAGSLLGSMFMGGGMGAAGAGGMGFLDIILIGGLIYLVYRLFLRRKDSQPAARQQSHNPQPQGPQGSAWDHLSSSRTANAAGYSPDAPADFDQEDFLRGAKMAYVRMQESWDKRDLDDISQFATAAVMKTLQDQAAQDPKPSTTELLLVNATIQNISSDGTNQNVSVFFDVLMREDPTAQQNTQVKEVWHFTRPLGSHGMWKLDGIQQVAN